MSGRLLLPLLLALALATPACSQAPTTPPDKKPEAKAPEAPAATAATAGGVEAGAAPQINAARAMQYVREIVGMGPRPVGSAGHRKLEAYLLAHLKGDPVETDEFTATTPVGSFPMRNYIARYPGTKEGVIVIATHYDTVYSLKNFVGANDGGSGTGLLLELAHQLRTGKREGPSVWLVWLDGEEAFKQWSPTDSVYGSRHLAQKWQKDGTTKKIKAFLLLDMIGDADLNINRDSNSTPALLAVVEQAATRLGYQSHFFRREIAAEDDHQPFAAVGVPVADLIDFEYGYGEAFWHTPEDTLDKLSPRSLEIVGKVVLESVRLLGQ
jgi:Zn-dependent M28 family amino/carboxypeptidase